MDKGVPFYDVSFPAAIPAHAAPILGPGPNLGSSSGHLASQLDETGQLCQAPLPPHGKGGLMLVGVPTSPAGQCDPRRAVRDILTVCQGRGFGGVILDLEQPPTRFLSQLICGLEEGLTSGNGPFSCLSPMEITATGRPSI